MARGFINNWHKVWSARMPPDEHQVSVLQRLICIDGFDTPLGLVEEGPWNDYVALFSTRTGIRHGDSVFEMGCGSGAFLYPLYKTGHAVSGIDYSLEMIRFARSAMPERRHVLNKVEASLCPVSPKADVVIANHVIHYFPTIDYSSIVLGIMLEKSRRVVGISGIPDADLKSESESYRRSLLRADEYEAKYRGLEILYYERQWFVKHALAKGFTARFLSHEMPGFAQNRFRYDCVMTRS